MSLHQLQNISQHYTLVDQNHKCGIHEISIEMAIEALFENPR